MPDTRQGPDFLGVSMVGKPGIDLYVPTFVTQVRRCLEWSVRREMALCCHEQPSEARFASG